MAGQATRPSHAAAGVNVRKPIWVPPAGRLIIDAPFARERRGLRDTGGPWQASKTCLGRDRLAGNGWGLKRYAVILCDN